MTFGGFDLCHLGHINLLRQAKERCDELIVCVSTDEYLKEKKGYYPLLELLDRIYLVKLTRYADKVIEQSLLQGKQTLITLYRPDILFVGSDWKNKKYNGKGLCEVEYLKHTNGISSSWYRERIKG